MIEMFVGYRTFWWEEFFDVERNIFNNDYRFTLISKETGQIVALGDNVMELNELALKALDKIFEENVLTNK